MENLFDGLFRGPDANQLVRVSARLLCAAMLGGILGIEREAAGKAAGMRTHMLVALGAAIYVLFPIEAGMAVADVSRVIQGVATGIGFIGAGTILKRTESEDIRGLTTAAGLWLTTGVGLAVGMGHLWLPVLGTGVAWVVLRALGSFEARVLR
jgi:putative Mg2+ transporter-C (MgtC) family protein